MSLKVCVLVSGSSGNCIYVASPNTAILVDAGLSCRETMKRLESIGAVPASIKAVCITHEHGDHVSSIGPLQRRLGADLYANSGTIDGISRDDKMKSLPWKVFTTGSAFTIGDLRIHPFTVNHNANDPVGFVVSDGKSSAGIVTDTGEANNLTREKLKGCQVVVVEFNHDEDMLKDSSRPWVLKQRIVGEFGHLSNKQACQLLADIASPELKTVFLAHLSGECNKPELAVKCARAALEGKGLQKVVVNLTYGDRASEVAEC